MRRTRRIVSDGLWERIKPLLPEHVRSPLGGRPPAEDRECLEGILWLLRSGARWQDIPADFPSPSTCWRRLRDWSGEGILDAIHEVLLTELEELGELDFDQLVMDATFLRGKKGVPTLARPSAARG